MRKITENTYYVGVNDRNKSLFEGLWPLPAGVSYNSYLIVDDKVCLIDTVEADYFMQFLENVREVLGDRQIDYIVVNHMEPDHSGSLALMHQYYPDAKVVGNKKTFGMMQGFYGVDGGVEVRGGDKLPLGTHELQFVLTPMVHWPETMVTLDTTTHTLFSGDAFGCFGALNGGVLDADINCDVFWPEMTRYYSNIVGKYGIPVQNALKKLAGIQVDRICSTHGPVWQQYVERVTGIYDRLSRYDADPGLVVCYGTMYGNTERMAEAIAEAASRAGVRDIVMHNVSKSHHSYILADVFRYRGLIVGAPTYNGGLYHEMDVLLSEIAGRDVKGRLFGWFGSHCWASKAVARIGEWNDTKLKFEAVGTPVDMCQGFTADVRIQCAALGDAMGRRLLESEG